MKELDDFVHQHLDQSNFPPLIADVGKAALKHAGLESTIDTANALKSNACGHMPASIRTTRS